VPIVSEPDEGYGEFPELFLISLRGGQSMIKNELLKREAIDCL
jgi:hypothetical protein